MVEQRLREAERALEEQRSSDAVVVLGDLLARDADQLDESDLSGQDFFLADAEVGPGQPVQKSLLRTARQMIGGLPAAAMETYQLRYGATAKKLLNQASVDRDWEKVQMVRRRYFHTFSGFEASWLLAQEQMYLGHPLAASLLLDDVVTQDRAVQHLGQSVLVLHASACQLAKRPVPALPPGEMAIGSGNSESTLTVPSVDQQADWLSDRSRQLDGFDRDAGSDYAMFGASPSRNGGSAGQIPLTNLRWMLGTTASPRQERTLRVAAEELASSGKLPPPSWMPIRVGDHLLMRTTERLVGVDYRTGKRVWTYPWQPVAESADDDELAFDDLTQEDGVGDLLGQRVWNDVPYGQVTSDGTRAFMLDNLGEVEMMSFNPMMNFRGTRPAETSTNTLVALEMATEGKLSWMLGAGADDASTLSDAFFLGPPLPVDGRLYVMVEIAGDINLCCLDPETGNEIWRQHLVAVESGGIDNDPIRRVGGAVPTYHEGVLICPTGAGATVAIDLADRMLRWGAMYERNTEMLRSLSGRGRGVEASQLMQRWDNGAAIADGMSVLVTPIESDRLFGFDLLTGKSLFAEKPRVQMRYLAGIRDGQFYVVGGNAVRAFSLDSSGTGVWTTRDLLTTGQQISGRGVFGKGTYLVPTTTNQLIQVSLKDGSILQRRNTRYPLGNLIAVDGDVIAQGPTSLAVAFGEATLEPIVNRMLKNDPNDFEALVRKSELLIQREQRSEALEYLERARQMEPDNDEVHLLSISAMLGLLRQNADVDPALIETLDSLIDRPAQRVELLSLRIRSALDKQDSLEAGKLLIDFSSLLLAEPMSDSVADQVIDDLTRQCTLDSWLAARVDEVARVASEDDIQSINEMLASVAGKRTSSSTSDQERFYRHFRPFEGVKTVRDELAQRYQSAGDFLRLERMLLGTRLFSASDLANWPSEDAVLLAEAYAQGGLVEDSLAVLRAIEKQGDASAQDDQPAKVNIFAANWPEKVSVNWESRQLRTRFGNHSQRVSKTEVLAGQRFKGWKLISDGTLPFALRDPNGTPRMIPIEGSRQSEEIDKEAQISGGVMSVLLPNGLAMINLYGLLGNDTEAVLWQRNLSGDGNPIANRRGVPTPFGEQVIHRYMNSASAAKVIPEFKMGPILGDRVLMLQGGDLVAVDLMTKETLWRNSTAPRSGVVVSNGELVAVVSPVTSEIVFFDVLDGRKVETKRWTHGEVWESVGRHVLGYDLVSGAADVAGPFRLVLVDPFTDQVKQQTVTGKTADGESAGAAYGRIVDGRYLVMLESSGQALIWDLVDGREIGRPELPAFDDLDEVYATLLDDQMIILPKRRIVRPKVQMIEQLRTGDGAYHQTTHGVFAISMNDGSLRWGTEFDKPWGCTLTQAPATPILILARSPFTHSVQSRSKYLDVMGLDLRDGREWFKEERRPIHSGNNELEVRLNVQSVTGRVIAEIGSELLTFQFGEPVQPAVQPEDQPQP
ncbi:outer membrane protein assembly factor BamB family protein [Rubripirellula lacrimiformis]|uniref:outer membrane protein assembly factor BamB family protein n=1 Tax=Rubripirellula lacrimiformis TaxID=1930273 RepID=UPI001C54DE47|nr:PQQ-binding-like beta-propeller repeat protein [Rubripirellula lacrimiformis]